MSNERGVVLYGDSLFASPYVFSVYVSLREKGVPFRYESVDLGKLEQKRPDYTRKSLFGRVPMLCHGDFCISESSAIVDYLEDAFPAPEWPRVLPSEGRALARARQVMSWIRSADPMPIREERPSDLIFRPAPVSPLTTSASAAVQRLFYVVDQLVPDGATTAFGAWSTADADLAFMLHRLIAVGDDVPAKARAYAAAQWARPSVQEFVRKPR